ncbi:hypothetical protein AB205_0092980, partial [Aquarana catesbeiana]
SLAAGSPPNQQVTAVAGGLHEVDERRGTSNDDIISLRPLHVTTLPPSQPGHFNVGAMCGDDIIPHCPPRISALLPSSNGPVLPACHQCSNNAHLVALAGMASDNPHQLASDNPHLMAGDVASDYLLMVAGDVASDNPHQVAGDMASNNLQMVAGDMASDNLQMVSSDMA